MAITAYDTSLFNLPKVHLLVSHVPEFVKRNFFWGLLSEQGVEAVHHLINMDIQTFSNCPTKDMLSRKICEQSTIRNFLHDIGKC